MSTENAALMRRWFDEVWNKGRTEAIDEMFAADGIAYGLGEAGVDVRGPAAFKLFVERMRGAFPDFELTIDDTITEGDKVAARWTARMTHQGDHLGLPATGKQVVITGMSIIRVRDGQIVEGWNNWDISGLMQQLGAYRPPATLLE
ncbi:MAG TPA: ester cyclase [Pyrinomonadaceae bacterium]|nr:ester cyclase [Pyrinomonadaceae bacterium]